MTTFLGTNVVILTRVHCNETDHSPSFQIVSETYICQKYLLCINSKSWDTLTLKAPITTIVVCFVFCRLLYTTQNHPLGLTSLNKNSTITKTSLFKYTENFTNKTENFHTKVLRFIIFLLKNIDCGYLLEPPRRGGSIKYPQCMFLSRNKKNNVYPCKPPFYYIKGRV